MKVMKYPCTLKFDCFCFIIKKREMTEFCISPVADSCNERWHTKLMMMGKQMDK